MKDRYRRTAALLEAYAAKLERLLPELDGTDAAGEVAVFARAQQRTARRLRRALKE